MDYAMTIFLRFGALNSIINYINMNKINIHVDNEEGFRSACCYGHKHIVEYLINLHKQPPYSKINIHACNEYGIRLAHLNGYKHIIKYLLSCGSYSKNYKYIIIL